MRIIDLPEKTNIEKNDYIAVDQNQTITKNFKPSYLGYTPSYTIANGSDLQDMDFLNPGMYVCANEDNAKSLKHCPVSVPFIMDVYHVDETGDCTRFEKSFTPTKNTKTRRVITEISTDSIDKYTQLVTTDDNQTLSFGDWTINYNQKSSIVDFIYPVGAIYISMNAISPAKLFGGSWERIYNCFLWAGAEWKTLGTSESDTNTYTFTETTMARFGDPASNQWAYFDIPAGSYTRGQAVNLLNGLDPAYGVVKTLQVIDPSGTPEVGTTFGEATHTLTIDEMPSHSHTAGSYDGFKIKNDWFQTSGGSVPHNVIGVINNGQNNYEDGLSTSILTNTTGGGKSHNNMPPALIANMWKRVS